MERGTPEEVSDKKASDDERARWRELRTRLAGPPPPPSGAPASAARKHVRVLKKLRVSYAPVQSLSVAFSEEVGAGGLRLQLKQHVDVGTQFVLRLELAGAGDPDPLTVTARVAWVRRDGNHFQVGLELIGLRADERERIDAYALSAKDAPDPPPEAKKP